MRLSIVIGLSIGLVACTIDDLQHEKRYCATDYPCAEGYVCQQNKCVAKGGTNPDGPGPVADGPLDGKSDLPKSDLFVVWDQGPKLDGPVVDQMSVPDAGCPSGLTNCGGKCIDVSTSYDHCGNCFSACQPGVSDRCENGKCHCGHVQPLCLNGLTCFKGNCQCITGPSSMCNGCCQNGVCQPGTSTSACGTGAVACSICKSFVCKQAVCSNGQCGTQNMGNGTKCVAMLISGACYDGSCCTGCWNGTTCMKGTAPSACGRYGALCQICNTPLLCQNGKCTLKFP